MAWIFTSWYKLPDNYLSNKRRSAEECEVDNTEDGAKLCRAGSLLPGLYGEEGSLDTRNKSPSDVEDWDKTHWDEGVVRTSHVSSLIMYQLICYQLYHDITIRKISWPNHSITPFREAWAVREAASEERKRRRHFFQFSSGSWKWHHWGVSCMVI